MTTPEPVIAAGQAAETIDPKKQKEIITRQRERTIDNVKRLFAIVFSLSFAAAAASFFESLQYYRFDDNFLPLEAWNLVTNVEMHVLFVITAGVFYYHGTKFLDNRYAVADSRSATPLGFAYDFGTLVLQMVPFVFMAQSLSPKVTNIYGFTWFFASYVFAFMLGLVLLIIGKFRDIFGRDTPDKERQDTEVVRHYWMCMNGTIIGLIGLGFLFSAKYLYTCPTNPGLSGDLFLLFFGVIALTRDILDFRWMWPFTFPQDQLSADNHKYWPMSLLEGHGSGFNRWFWIGLALILFDFAIAGYNRWYDVGHWIAVCRS